MKISPKYTPESQLARVLLTLRGFDEFELARRTECNVSTIRNLLSDGRSYPALSLKVEAILGVKIWSYAGGQNTHNTTNTIMKCRDKTLPERLEPFREQILPLHEAKGRIDEQIADNEAKLTTARAERDELSSSDPGNEENIRRLAESQVRVQLLENHGTKLKAASGELTSQAAGVTAAFARELQKIAVECESVGRERSWPLSARWS